MYDITRFDTTQRLLYDILEELRLQKTTPELSSKLCLYCGNTHENKGQELNCAKKFKKKEK
jgi:hypothetical protein